ncbi:replicative DNA helicase [Paenibacillus sp. BK033]|uniref:DnaB-like helicase C-terminal domain-containing protein n=1 Tax=Paenibacillus sp. BK033 TaxID=2512133 RepID=UPI001053B567|nr:DnaB-like helicase C-terminal domain-containing protein [Paenibacillus sp. BK033]TCM89657.1 replicative DNA helicase [Paenibacillus sp. BK033]
MSVAETLISKVIDANDITAFDRFGVKGEHFLTETERKAYEFTRKYIEENGQAPSYATLVANVPDFTYIPAVTDTYEYLTGKLKEKWGKRQVQEYFASGEISHAFDAVGKTSNLDEFFSTLTGRLEGIKLSIGTSVRNQYANIADSGERFLAEYEARASGQSNRIWKSKFPSLNAALGGGYYSSNMYVIYARSGRGKSIVAAEEAIEFAFQGATLLIYALEMGWFEWMARAFSSISARYGITNANIGGIDYDAGFDNRALQSAKLTPEYEEAFRKFIAELNTLIPGRIILRATDEEGFTERNLAALKSDIKEHGADVVIVDPFYYLEYEANTSKTAGGDAAATSRKLRIMTGSLGVLTIAITQADEDASEKGDDGVRELKPPKRAEVKKTKQLLEDGAALIGLDTLAHEGRGVIEIGKGRSGGEDTRIEIVYLPNWGIVREPDNEAAAAMFAGNF